MATENNPELPQGYFPIAIVGIGCRMPGGVSNTNEFWEVLTEGRECIQDIPADRWAVDSFYDPDQTRQGKMVTRRCGFLDNINDFDNLFFKISPREAASMDPQQRHLLEVTWEAFEDAGIVPGTLKRDCGVFVGIGLMDHAIQLSDTCVTDAYTLTGIAHSVASNRISYCLDFQGPSFSVDTACAAGLTAIHLACTSLYQRECKIAAVASVNHIALPDTTVEFSALGVLSPDGKCSPFSESANGYVRSEGCHSLILKPLDRAIEDGDHIYSVVKGSVIGDNGYSSSLTMPSVPAMENIMNESYRKFGIPKSRVNFLEAHGTGTHVGDPLEAEAIGRSFASARRTPLKIGSIKGNFGHNEIAAGTASAVKVALMMDRRALVPTINFVESNHNIDMKSWKLNLLTEVEPFTDEKYIIGLNSFGFAGALAHCIFEEAPDGSKIRKEATSSCGWKFGKSPDRGKPILIPLSAKSPEALQAVARQWSSFENENDALNIVSWLATHRSHFDYRLSVIADSGQEFKNQLYAFVENGSSDKVLTATVYSSETPKICLIFPGQGQQWVDMGRQLYKSEDVFKKSIDECDLIFKAISGWSLLEDRGLFVEGDTSIDKDVFNDLQVSQPAILFLQIAYFRLLKHWGVVPEAIVGHSLGEVAAAYAGGGLTLEEAILVIYIRSVEQGKLKGTGSMAALRMNLEEALELCSRYKRLYIAAYNAPGSVTIAGCSEAIDEICGSNPTIAKKLHVSCAFHTPDMDPTEKTFKSKMENAVQTPAGVRTVPIYSTTTGKRHDGDFCTDYWWTNIRNAVKFQQAVESIIADVQPTVFIECAASMTLLSSINAIAKGAGCTAQIRTIAMGQRRQDDRISALRALHEFHSASVSISWGNVTCHDAPWVPLPLYPWQHVTSLTESDYRRKRRLGLDDRTYKGQNGLLTLEVFPYLNDYYVKEDLLFPKSGLLTYAMEVVPGKFPLGLRNVSFQEDAYWKHIKIGAGSKKQLLALHCEITGDKIAICDEENVSFLAAHVTSNLSSSEEKGLISTVGAMKRRCSDRVPREEFYSRLEKSGTNIGPSFQVIQEAMVGDGEIIASVRSRGDKYGVTTTTLDACLQILAFPVTSEATTFVLKSIKSFTMHNPTIPHDEQLTILGKITDCDNKTLTGDVRMSCGRENTLVAEFTGCVFTNTAETTGDVRLTQCLYETIYQPTSAVMPHTSVVEGIFSPANLKAIYPDLMESIARGEEHVDVLRAICDAYIRHGLETVSENEMKASNPRYIKRLRHIAGLKNFPKIAYDEICPKMEELLKIVPEYAQEVSMIKSLGDHFPTTLRDPPSVMTKLFKPECMAAYFMESLTTSLYYAGGADIVVEALKTALSRKRVVRILEVGARMGGLTKHILEKIKPLCEERRVEYIFTDLSVAFFPHAKDNLQEYPFVKYQQLDIEQDVEGQGFVPSSIDILICLDTLHSTADLYDGVYHMRNLIADDGWFVLYEATGVTYIAELLFGALRLCWIYEDFRTECCWMDEPSWVDIVRQCGFTDVVAVSSSRKLFHSIIVGKKSGGYEGFAGKNVAKKTLKQWTVITSNTAKSDLPPSVEERINANGANRVDKISYDQLKERKAIVNGIKQPPGETDRVFSWNKSDQAFENLLRFLICVGKESEHVSRVWVVIPLESDGSVSTEAAKATSVVRSASNHIKCPVFSVQVSPNEGDYLLLADILGKQQVPHREIRLFNGAITEPKLAKANVPELVVQVTPFWELHVTSTDTNVSKPCLAFTSWSPYVGADDILIKVKGADMTGLLPNHGPNGTDVGRDSGIPCTGTVVRIGEDVTDVDLMDDVFTVTSQSISSYVSVPQSSAIKIPRNLSWTDSATSLLAFSVAYHCLIERAKLARGETVLLCSLSPEVSLAAIQIGRLIGAKVTVYANTKRELESLDQAEDVRVLHNETKLGHTNGIESIPDAMRFNVVLLASVTDAVLNKYDVLQTGGRVCHLANQGAPRITTLTATSASNCSFLSVDIDRITDLQLPSSRGLVEKVAEMFEEGIFIPLRTRVYTTDQVVQALDDIRGGDSSVAVLDVKPHHSFPLKEMACTQTIFQPNICYIIIGSGGGFEQALARWLCVNGARHIAFITDGKTTTAVTSRTKEFLESRECNIHHLCMDGSKGNGIEAMIGDLRNKLLVVAKFGVFHAMGYSAEKLGIADLTPDAIQDRTGPSVGVLDELLQEIGDSNLEILVTFTPDGSIWGSTTDAASGILEAHHSDRVRRLKDMGKAAINVQLSHLQSLEVYDHYRKESDQQSAADGGSTVNEGGLHIGEFLQFMETILLSTEKLPASVSVEKRNWSAIIQQCHRHHLKCRHLAAGEQVAQTECRLSLDELEICVREKLGDLLCINPATIDLNQPMINYGIDSLMSVEMVTWASREWGVVISQLDILGGVTTKLLLEKAMNNEVVI